MATDETEEIQIWFIRSYNSPKYNPHIDIITKNKYRELNILKMDIRFDEKSFTVLKDAVYILPEVVTTIDSNEIGWIANNNYYWLNGLLAKRIGKYSDQWPMLEFHKFFKNKKEGDSFIFNIFLEYYFDDNEIKTETLNYQVHVSTK